MFLICFFFLFTSLSLPENQVRQSEIGLSPPPPPPSKKEKTVWPGVSESRLRNMSPGRECGVGSLPRHVRAPNSEKDVHKGGGGTTDTRVMPEQDEEGTHIGAARGGLSESKQSVLGIHTWGDLERITRAQAAGRAIGTPSPQSLASKHQSPLRSLKQMAVFRLGQGKG